MIKKKFLSITIGFLLILIFNSENLYSIQEKKEKFEVTAIEDLMREHGLLRRIFLIYNELILKIDRKDYFSFETVIKTINILKDFIEDYHEKLEEKYIFPLFEKDLKLSKLTKILLKQHEIGRKLTEEIRKIALKNKTRNNQIKLKNLFKKYIKMYRAHASREDTQLFPKIHFVIEKKQYDKLGDIFENEEKKIWRIGF